jgi:hypothetical protein
MKRHRTIICIGGLLVAFSASMPAAASASSLLSGYGGPGQGNQAILGSALLNSPKGGGGGSAGTSDSSTSLAAEPSERSSGSANTETGSGAQPAPRGSGGSGKESSSGARGSSKGGAQRKGRGRSRTGQPAVAASFYPASERVPASQQGTALGLSGDDLLYIVLGAAALAFVGVLTRRLSRTEAPVQHR